MQDTGRSPVFVTTRWSVVTAARQEQSAEQQDALETLCRTYWYPLYAYVRRAGHTAHDAQDLTQEFFARLLAKEWLDSASHEKGRFRSFLLVAMKRFLAKEWHRNRAQKRGGQFVFVPLDTIAAEQRYAHEPGLEAEAVYERRWALMLLEQALDKLASEFASAGKADDFETLKPWLTAERGEIPYAELAAKLSSSAGATRVAMHRMRRRFRELFKQAIAETVADSSEIADELLHLARILGPAV
jgi:RNA polymerase sigma-70 factor (ECF subfamily)